MTGTAKSTNAYRALPLPNAFDGDTIAFHILFFLSLFSTYLSLPVDLSVTMYTAVINSQYS